MDQSLEDLFVLNRIVCLYGFFVYEIFDLKVKLKGTLQFNGKYLSLRQNNLGHAKSFIKLLVIH